MRVRSFIKKHSTAAKNNNNHNRIHCERRSIHTMSKKIQIPDFYIALVLADGDDMPCKPNQKHLEALRQPTIDFLVPILKKSYPSLMPNLDLQFRPIMYRSKKPEPRFHIYWVVQATACLNTKSKAHRKTPKPQDLFDSIGAALDSTYVLQVVRDIDQDTSPLANAVEVQVRCIKKDTPGGSVQAPAFYMGFVCSQEPNATPTEEEKERLLQLAHLHAVKHLQNEFKSDFNSLTLKIVKTEIGDQAGKPDETFNLYVQFEAIVIFSHNAPEPMDVFRVMTKCVSSEFMGGLHSDVGGPFALAMNFTIRVCVWLEFPELVPAEPAEGDGDPEPIIVTLHVEFFVALVMKFLQGIPSELKRGTFDSLMTEFFSQLLLAKYGADRFVGMAPECTDALFQAGRPLPRFNMLHQYKATLQFVSPPPDPVEVLTMIVNCNVSALLSHINDNKPSSPEVAWDKTSEVTLGRGVAKPPKDQKYGGRIDLPSEKKKKKMEKTEVAPIPSMTPPPIEKLQIQPKRKPSSPPKKTPPPRQKSKVGLPKVPLIEAPLKQKESEPPASNDVCVKTSDVYVAFTIMDCNVSPTPQDYSALVETTKNFYTVHLQSTFGDNFLNLKLSVREALFDSEKPSDKYNVYVAWYIDAFFSDGKTAPDRHRLCQSLIFLDIMKYLKEHARSLSETPFCNAIGIYTQQVNS